MKADIQTICIPAASSIRQAIMCIDRNGKGVALVTDDERRLLGTVTDGDVRRAVLAGQDLDAVSDLLARKINATYPQPITAPVGSSHSVLLKLMQTHVIRQIPLLDPQRRVVDLITMDQLLPEEAPPLKAVIMAGGYGTRLQPLTQNLPKPMLPVGNEPILELIIKRLRRAGIRQVHISTHYKADKITEHFGDGSPWGVQLQYLTEDRPLGTAGALGLMEAPKEPILVMNGDILTKVNFRAMLDFHKEHKADMTVAVQKYGVQIAYGVIETDGFNVQGLREKPKFLYLVNAGIYLMEPSVPKLIPKGQRFDMTELIQKIIDRKRSVVSFPIMEYWLDIGNHQDYKQAQDDAAKAD